MGGGAVARALELPRRVLMTADAVGGVWTYALDLAAGLSVHGVRTVLAVTGPLGPEERRRADAVPGVTVEAAPFKLEWMDGADADLGRANDWLGEIERRVRPEIVHLNGYAAAIRRWSSPTVLVAHSCLATWWRAVERASPGPQWDGYRDRVQRAFMTVDAVVAPSHAFLADLRAAHGARAALEHAVVIHNGRDSSGFSPALPKEHFVLAAGRLWDRGKGIDLLAEAAEGLDWPVYAAGPLLGPDGVEARLQPLHCLGSLGDRELAGWMGRAAIFAAPARYEPFGLTALEAALSGAALVLSDLPSFRELWDGAALFVPQGDARALRASLEELIADAERIATLAESARERARRYGAAQMALGYAELYAGLIAERDCAARPRRAAG